MEDKIFEIIRSVVPALDEPTAREIREGGNLIKRGVIDSLTLVELLGALEEEYSIEFGPDDMDMQNFDTLKKIAALVNNKKSLR